MGLTFLLNLIFLMRFSEALASVKMKKSVLVCIKFLSKLVLGPCPLLNSPLIPPTFCVAILRVGRGISRCCPRPTSGAGWVECDDDDDDDGDEVKEDDSLRGGEVVGRVASTGGKS